MPECICIQECPKPKHSGSTVCGSDGKEYSSHCELHRTACLTNTLLTIDRSNACSNLKIETKDDDYQEDDAEEEEDNTESDSLTNSKYLSYRKQQPSFKTSPKGRLHEFLEFN